MTLASQHPDKISCAVAASIATIEKNHRKNKFPHGINREMQSPLDTGYISSGFGIRRDPINGSQRFHEGSILQRQSVLKNSRC